MKDNKYSPSAHAELAQIAFFTGTSTSLVISILNLIDNIVVAGDGVLDVTDAKRVKITRLL